MSKKEKCSWNFLWKLWNNKKMIVGYLIKFTV